MIKQLLAPLWQPIKSRLLYHSSSAESNDLPILKERNARPSHYLLNIESFNELSKNLLADSIIGDFEAGGYKWSLVIFFNGDEDNDGKNHISVYLEVANPSDLPVGWEINAIFNFFIYDQLQDKYIGLLDARERRFHSMKSRWGVAKFIDLKTFNDPFEGYLINDSCTFGVEVFIVENTCKEECLQMIWKPQRKCKYTWKFDNFSKTICDEWYKSDFSIHDDYKWRILLNPSCHSFNKGSITIGLEIDVSSLLPNTKLIVNYVFRVLDQTKQEHHESSGAIMCYSSNYGDYLVVQKRFIKQETSQNRAPNFDDCISNDNSYSFKLANFMSLTKLQDPKMGYLVNDTCVIEAEVEVLALSSPFGLFN